jgi:hypothetical protein
MHILWQQGIEEDGNARAGGKRGDENDTTGTGNKKVKK